MRMLQPVSNLRAGKAPPPKLKKPVEEPAEVVEELSEVAEAIQEAQEEMEETSSQRSSEDGTIQQLSPEHSFKGSSGRYS